MSVSKWFERKFDFSFDVSEYAAIYQRLQKAPAALAEILYNIPDDALSHQPDGTHSC
jgi:hypothetical protein